MQRLFYFHLFAQICGFAKGGDISFYLLLFVTCGLCLCASLFLTHSLFIKTALKFEIKLTF